MVELGGLENRCLLFSGPWVRIPLSPPYYYTKKFFDTFLDD